jgi:hypothetical protein
VLRQGGFKRETLMARREKSPFLIDTAIEFIFIGRAAVNA